MQDLNIALLQFAPCWEDKEETLARLTEQWLTAAPADADVWVLPEMFSTGFTMQAKALAEPADGATYQWMRSMAEMYGKVLCGSFITLDNGAYYNRFYWVQPDGICHTYSKRHLFSLAKEEEHYAAGTSKTIIEYKGWRILPLICYDLRFPVFSRRTPEADYDLLLYVASWPERRSYAWKQLLVARAIENQAYVAGVNRVGNDGNGILHAGDSAILNFYGKPMQQAPAFAEKWTGARLVKEALLSFRQRFPFAADADRFRMEED